MEQPQIRAKDEDLKGNFSNSAQVSHTSEEFIMDFFLNAPPGPMLVSRVITNPGHMKKLIKAFQENMEKFESKFGKIEETEDKEVNFGFKN